VALLWPACGSDLVNRSGPPKCHHSMPRVAQIIIPLVADVGRIWAGTKLLSGECHLELNIFIKELFLFKKYMLIMIKHFSATQRHNLSLHKEMDCVCVY